MKCPPYIATGTMAVAKQGIFAAGSWFVVLRQMLPPGSLRSEAGGRKPEFSDQKADTSKE